MSQQPSTSSIQQDRTPLVDYQDESDNNSNIEGYEAEGTPMEEDREEQEVTNHGPNREIRSTSTVRSPGSLFSDYADPKAVMENIIHHYKVKLDRLLVQYNRALPSAGSEMLQSRQADIIKTQKTLFQFRAAYKQEYVDGQDQGNTTARSTDRMTAKDVPLFQVVGSIVKNNKKDVFESVDHFLLQFKKVIEANTGGKIDKHWSKWLPLAFPHEHDHWYEQKLAGRNYGWSKVCKIIKKRFQSSDLKMSKATEAYTMTMNKGETVADYGTRFLNVCRDGGLKDNEGLALRFLGSMDEHIQENVKIAWSGRYGTRMPRTVEEVLRVANAVSLNERSRRQDDNVGPSNQRRRHNNNGGSQGFQGSKKNWCPHHKKYVSHKPQECHLHIEKVNSSLSSVAENRFKRGECVHCGAKWTKEHRCEEYRNAQKKKREGKQNVSLNAISTPTPNNSDTANQSEQMEVSHPGDTVLEELLAEEYDELEAFAA
ncbi:hypothetical protein INT45_013283, partial [Circinella minor]